MSKPCMFAVFLYDPSIGVQVYVGSTPTWYEAVVLAESKNQKMYYAIYKYSGVTFHFGSTQKANTYELVLKMNGKENNCKIPFSPYEVAHKFENEQSWYYQTHQ